MAGEAKFLAFDLGAESGRGVVGFFDGEKVRLEDVHRFANQPVKILDTLYWDVLRLFAELKQRLRVDRVRLRRLWNVAEQFHLAATAQNLKRLVQFLARGQPGPTLSTT